MIASCIFYGFCIFFILCGALFAQEALKEQISIIDDQIKNELYKNRKKEGENKYNSIVKFSLIMSIIFFIIAIVLSFIFCGANIWSISMSKKISKKENMIYVKTFDAAQTTKSAPLRGVDCNQVSVSNNNPHTEEVLKESKEMIKPNISIDLKSNE